MSTVGQFSSKNPTIKRILKEASELANQPSADYHAAPLETDLFEWHFTLRGPPSPSAYEGGIYHGRIVLPPAYPLKPPSFRFLTPTGRFEVNREICLSISGHHEETWQPAWGIRTALVAIRSFMDTSASGQLGGMETSEEVRRRLAGQSGGWKCGVCGKANEEVMREQVEAVREAGGEEKGEEVVPEELRLAYRDDLTKETVGQSESKTSDGDVKEQGNLSMSQTPPLQNGSPSQGPVIQPQPAVTTAALSAAPTVRVMPRQNDGVPAWIDKAIYGIVAALVFLICRRWLS